MQSSLPFYSSEISIGYEFALAVEARFDDLSGAQQKVFDIVDAETGTRLWLGQTAGNDMEFGLMQNGVVTTLIAEDALIEGETGTWRVDFTPFGTMSLSLDGQVLAEADGALSAAMDAPSVLIGQSTYAGDDDLIGHVGHILTAPYGEGGEDPNLGMMGQWIQGDIGAASISATDVEGDGEFSGVIALTIIPLHSIVLPDGKVLGFGSTEQGFQGGQFVYSLFDPETGVEEVLPNTTGVNTFCSNMSLDPATGNVIIMGGDANGTGNVIAGINDVVVFDYETRTIRDADLGDMEYARWYPTTVNLPNGEILCIGGRDGDYNGITLAEVYNAETGWRTLTDAEMPDFADVNEADRLNESWWYPHVFVNSLGEVIVIEAEGDDIYRMTTEGTGSVEKIGQTGFDSYKLNSSIMYDVDRIAIIGDDGGIYTADISEDVPSFTKVAKVEGPRTNAGMIPLPDGRIAVTGGGNTGYQGNDLDSAVNTVTIWDPENNSVEQEAEGALARLYHSSHLLLPDGTIWIAGGGAPGPLTNTNAELYAPEYLYADDGSLAERPVIEDAPTNIAAGQTFQITVDDTSDISQITAVKSGAMTHGRNVDGRFLELDHKVIDSTTIEISTSGATIMIGGLWMLYAVDEAGTPSVASMLGVDMGVEITETAPLEQDSLQYFNIDDEITGAFDLSVEARFDDLGAGAWQRVFDFGNGEYQDNIWLGQVAGSNTMGFEVFNGAQSVRIEAPNAIVEGELAEWSVSVDGDGLMQLWKNGALLAEGQGYVPADVERALRYVGDSNWVNDTRLVGQVRNLEVVNAGDTAETAGQFTMPAPDPALVFEAEATVRYDDVDGGAWQRVYDFGNGPGADNLWLGQVYNSNDMRFEVFVNGTATSVTAEDALVEGETATWRTTIDTTGWTRLYKDGALVAEALGQIPEDVDRINQLVGESNWGGDTPLIGEVSEFEINETGPLDAPVLTLHAAADQTETDAGLNSTMVFSVTLDKISAQDVTAFVDVDGGAARGFVTIPAGESAASIFVRVEGDDVAGGDRLVSVSLSDIQGAELGVVDASAMLFDDEIIEPEDPEIAFEAVATARFDDVGGGYWQRVFDYGNGAADNNILLGQTWNSTDMRFEVYVGDTSSIVTAYGAIVEGETAEWRVTVDSDGLMSIYKNGDLLAEGPGQVPADVDRENQLIGESNWAADTPLIGEVSEFEINETGPLTDLPEKDGQDDELSLLAEFYSIDPVASLAEIDFDATPVHAEEVTTIDNYAGAGAFYEGGDTDNFAARYSGSFEAPTTGDYTFYLTSDDGSQLTINGEPIINNDGLHPDVELEATVSLSEGPNVIELTYFERGGDATLDLDWSGPAFDRQQMEFGADAEPEQITFGNSAYVLGTPGQSWEDANAEAQAMGGHLVEIDSAEENQFILETFGGSDPIWLGFTDRDVEGQFIDSTQSALDFMNWLAGEPNNDGDQDYAAMASADGKWDDALEEGGTFYNGEYWEGGHENKTVIEFVI